jgi:hypothetical protein
MSHHRKIVFIDESGTTIELGHVRITNDGEILSIWVDHMKRLFKPEVDDS